MYATCLFCHRHLGANAVVERFPVGERLAFDSARGRLWVVCPACARWNLTPLEERWEAVEDCERRFRATRLRASTGEVGLARLPGGLDLVRVGRPLGPELAAWRYGPRLRRRRWEAAAWVGAGFVALGAFVAFGAAVGGGLSAGALAGVRLLGRRVVDGPAGTVVARIADEEGRPADVRRRNLVGLQLRRSGEGRRRPASWKLHVPTDEAGVVTLTGPAADRALALLMPRANRFGGSAAQVAAAARLLDEGPTPDAALAALVRGQAAAAGGASGYVGLMAPEVRLALEIAAHADQERRALDGELAELVAAWREAEEIAAIADDLLVSASVRERLAREGAARRRSGPRSA